MDSNLASPTIHNLPTSDCVYQKSNPRRLALDSGLLVLMAPSATETRETTSEHVPSRWPMGDLVTGGLYGIIAGQFQFWITRPPRVARGTPFRERVFITITKPMFLKTGYLTWAAYGFLMESAFTLIYPSLSTRNLLLEGELERRAFDPVRQIYPFGSELTSCDNWALGGALGATAFAAILRLRGTEPLVSGWKRHVGAASLGAATGQQVRSKLREYQGKAVVR